MSDKAKLTPDERELLRIKFHQVGTDSAILYVERLIAARLAGA